MRDLTYKTELHMEYGAHVSRALRSKEGEPAVILSLSTPKHRIVTGSGLIFYNDFNNNLHVELDGVETPLALNLGLSNWTVSDTGEVAFMLRDSDGDFLAIVDSVKRTRVFQRIEKFKLLDLLMVDGRFVGVTSGILLTGSRKENGALNLKGMRTLAMGADFRIQAEESGTIIYTKRGSCRKWKYSLAERKSVSEFEPTLLWDALFANSFKNWRPKMPKEPLFNADEIQNVLESGALEHEVTEAGVYLLALISLLQRRTEINAELLQSLVDYDWELQYTRRINKPFPTIDLLNSILKATDLTMLRAEKIRYQLLRKWCNEFEKGVAISRWAKPVSNSLFTDIWDDERK